MLGDLFKGVLDAAITIGAGTVLIQQLLEMPADDAVKHLVEMEAKLDAQDGYSSDVEMIVRTLRDTEFSDESMRRKGREIAYRFHSAMIEARKLVRSREDDEDLAYRLKSLRRRDRDLFVDVAAAIYAYADVDDDGYSEPARRLADFVDEEMDRLRR